MYDSSEIGKMGYKELRNSVQELYDKYTKLKRTIDDALDNIDESNLATTFAKKLNGYESKLSVTAEKIESSISYVDLENSLSQYSTIQQTADKILLSVNENREYTDNAKEELSSTFTITADRIESNVLKVKKRVDGNYDEYKSTITQTAEAIETLVRKKITLLFEKSVMPTKNNTTEEQKSMICKYKNKQYYFNQITQTWREYRDDGVSSAFKQTADGFELNGCVSVSGDLITSGTIKGVDIVGARFLGNSGKHKYFKVVSGLGDIGLFESYASDTATAINPDCVWGIVSPTQTGRTFHMCSYGQRILGFNDDQRKTYPMGTWDFSSCNVIGLPTTNTSE